MDQGAGPCQETWIGQWPAGSEPLQACLDLLAPPFQERRQGQHLAERVHRLVGGEAWAVSGDLEQDPVRLAEVETAEPEAVDRAARRHPHLVETLCPRLIVGLAAEFQRTFPSVGLNLRVEALGGIPELVLSGACWLGVQGSLPQIPAGLGLIPLPWPVVVEPVAAPDHPLALHLRPVPKDLLDAHPQIVLTDRSQRTEGRNFAVLSKRQVRTADLGSKQALLRGGLGWGFMPWGTVEDDIASAPPGLMRAGRRCGSPST
jgi:DNA-binding transcriptional LysR family regulator